jgi:hypothetical protein
MDTDNVVSMTVSANGSRPPRAQLQLSVISAVFPASNPVL